jgi:hypothetical protein
MAGSTDIIERIRVISKSGEDFRFHNAYRGLPITYDGRVEDVSEHEVRFAINRYQSICIRLENQTFLQNNLLPEVVRAKVVKEDPWAPAVVLTDFQYKGTLIGKRMHVRVEPDRSIRVMLGVMQNYSGEMTELSLRGVSVVINPPLYSAMAWNRGEKVPIEFRLPDVAQKHQVIIKVFGTVRYATLDRKKGGYRMGLQFLAPDQTTEAILSRYIAQRQAELLNELKLLSDREIPHTEANW